MEINYPHPLPFWLQNDLFSPNILSSKTLFLSTSFTAPEQRHKKIFKHDVNMLEHTWMYTKAHYSDGADRDTTLTRFAGLQLVIDWFYQTNSAWWISHAKPFLLYAVHLTWCDSTTHNTILYGLFGNTTKAFCMDNISLQLVHAGCASSPYAT